MAIRESQRSRWPVLIALGTGSALLLTNPSVAATGLLIAAFVLGLGFWATPLTVGVVVALPAVVAAIIVGAFDSVGMLALALLVAPFAVALAVAFAILGSMVGERLRQRSGSLANWDGPRVRATIAMVVAAAVVVAIPIIVANANR